MSWLFLRREAIERDREAEPVAMKNQIAVVFAIRHARLGQVLPERVEHQAIGFVSHGDGNVECLMTNV